jgi:Ion channel
VTTYVDMAPKQRRALVARALFRSVATAVLLVTLYYVLPFDHPSTVSSAIVLALGLVLVIVAMTWQLLAILRSDHPATRAIEALGLVVPLFLLVFSAAYLLMSEHAPDDFTQHLTRTDSLYFTVTTFATVGFGDITPTSQVARLVVTGQIVIDLAIIGVGVRLLTSAVQIGRQRQSDQPAVGTTSSAPGDPTGPI